MIPLFLQEIDQEAVTTRKMLERVPADKFDWQPHPKSMTLKQLSTHIAELPSWPAMAVNSTELDFASAPYEAVPLTDTKGLLELFEKSLAQGRGALEKADESKLDEEWLLRNGEQILATMTKASMIRISISQTIHHRAQLGVYLRLLNIPIPGSYGPSADDQNFQ